MAGLASLLVLVLWYPTPYGQVSGGRDLFLLLVAVDIAIGPLVTLIVFDTRKPRSELMRDMFAVGFLQLAALVYGLHAVAQARPVVVSLEVDRLRVVRAVDLARADMTKAPTSLEHLSWTGPRLIATRPPTETEKLEAIDRALAGEDVGMRPEFWLPAEAVHAHFAAAAKQLSENILNRTTPSGTTVRDAVVATGFPLERIGYLPILARRTDWTALIDRTNGRVLGFVNVDGF